MEKIIFSCQVENNSDSKDLALEFWLNDVKFFDNQIDIGSQTISHEFDETEQDHLLKVILKNKTVNHTTISDTGEIISDAVIQLHDISFDDINVDQLFFEKSKYSHDYNGSGTDITENFFGTLGCNGTVEFEFSTPFYTWLLDHM